MKTLNLNDLPASNIIEELDYEYLLNERKNKLLSLYPQKQREQLKARLELESDPIVKLLQETAYRELNLRAKINYSAKACMIAYATGGDLDNLVANFAIKRLLVAPANLETSPPIPAIYEDDEALRTRALMAFHGLSTAGPKTAYEFYAKSAHGAVSDVKALSPAPAMVDLVVLSKNNYGVPSANMLTTIENSLNNENIRPIGDRINVMPCNVIRYQIKAKIFISQNKNIIAKQGQENLTSLASRYFKIGLSLPLSAIYAALHIKDVTKVEILTPTTDLSVTDYEALYCDNIDIILI